MCIQRATATLVGSFHHADAQAREDESRGLVASRRRAGLHTTIEEQHPAFTDRWFFRPSPPAGACGYGLTTYMGDGNPLPPFSGDPLLLPLSGSPDEILDAYWNALDDDNRISLAVKSVAADGSTTSLLVRNRHGDA